MNHPIAQLLIVTIDSSFAISSREVGLSSLCLHYSTYDYFCQYCNNKRIVTGAKYSIFCRNRIDKTEQPPQLIIFDVFWLLVYKLASLFLISSLQIVNACPIRPHHSGYKIIFNYSVIYKCLLNPSRKQRAIFMPFL